MLHFIKTRKKQIPIPDNDLIGIRDQVAIVSDFKVQELYVILELDHSCPEDLNIILVSPEGYKETLSSPGRPMPDAMRFKCRKIPGNGTMSTRGNWNLQIIDAGINDTGRLLSWRLEFKCSGKPPFPIEDLSRLELLFPCKKKASVRALKLQFEIEHQHIGDLSISLVSPGGIENLLHDRTGLDATKLSKQFNTYELSEFKGQEAAGNWRFCITDALKGDTGILKSVDLEIDVFL